MVKKFICYIVINSKQIHSVISYLTNIVKCHNNRLTGSKGYFSSSVVESKLFTFIVDHSFTLIATILYLEYLTIFGARASLLALRWLKIAQCYFLKRQVRILLLRSLYTLRCVSSSVCKMFASCSLVYIHFNKYN